MFSDLFSVGTSTKLTCNSRFRIITLLLLNICIVCFLGFKKDLIIYIKISLEYIFLKKCYTVHLKNQIRVLLC